MKKIYEDLAKSGALKPVSGPGVDQAQRLLKRAWRDFRTAAFLLKEDEAAAMDFIYKGIFHAANAYLRLQGYRPGKIGQHAAVIEAMRRALGKEAQDLILVYDHLRRKRNEFEYQAVFSMSGAELRDMFESAKRLASVIQKAIETDHPQLRLNIE
jgi:uncharacterized protein (UPF0332 family)